MGWNAAGPAQRASPTHAYRAGPIWIGDVPRCASVLPGVR